MSEEKPIVTINEKKTEFLDDRIKKNIFEIHAIWPNGNEVHGYGETMVDAIADVLDSLEKAMLCLQAEKKSSELHFDDKEIEELRKSGILVEGKK